MPSTVTNRLQGLTTSVAVKAPVQTVSTSNVTLAGLQTFGIAQTEGSRHLSVGQSDASENGIYNASTGAWSRAADFDGDLDVVKGTIVLLNDDSDVAYRVVSNDPVIGTDDIDFEAVALIMTQEGIGQALFPRTATEIAASVTPSSYAREDGSSDRYSTLQIWADSFGTTASMHGGEHVLESGAHALSGTLTLNRKSGVFRGEGQGSADNETGSVLVWEGSAGSPMMTIKQSWGLAVRDLRFKGDSSAAPSAAILIDTGDQSPAPTAMEFQNIWIGTFGGFDSDNNPGQFVDGFVVDGAVNGQGDQSKISHITVQGCSNACIAFRNTQSVFWHIDTATLNLADYGIEAGARHIQARNVFCQTIAEADLYITADGSMSVEGFGSEIGGRFVQATDGASVSVRSGYWQAATASVTASGNVVDIASSGTASLELVDFDFKRVGGYAGPQEKIKVRGTHVVVYLKNVTLPGAPNTVLDLATTASGQTRSLYLLNVYDLSGNRYDGKFVWRHGDTVPSFNNVLFPGPETRTGAGAISVSVETTYIHTTGANALTLANGFEGQKMYLVMITDGGVGTLTPTNLYGGTTITFDDVGDSAFLMFMNGEWVFMGGTATLA